MQILWYKKTCAFISTVLLFEQYILFIYKYMYLYELKDDNYTNWCLFLSPYIFCTRKLSEEWLKMMWSLWNWRVSCKAQVQVEETCSFYFVSTGCHGSLQYLHVHLVSIHRMLAVCILFTTLAINLCNVMFWCLTTLEAGLHLDCKKLLNCHLRWNFMTMAIAVNFLMHTQASLGIM